MFGVPCPSVRWSSAATVVFPLAELPRSTIRCEPFSTMQTV
jgi:hypothetical protein